MQQRTSKLGEALKELAQAGALNDKDAIGVEATAAADHIRNGARRQHWRPPGSEAAQQCPVHVQHHCEAPLMLWGLQGTANLSTVSTVTTAAKQDAATSHITWPL